MLETLMILNAVIAVSNDSSYCLYLMHVTTGNNRKLVNGHQEHSSVSPVYDLTGF